MTFGYTLTDSVLKGKDRVATTKHLCGGPSGLSASATAPKEAEAARHL
jgi:hypothetical protein